jgi:DNA-directed RNA polymerase subunit RPC12/RpoP
MLVEKIRKNTKPKWYEFKGTYCLSCGNSFLDMEAILSGKFCSDCSSKKERDLKIDKDAEVYYYQYHTVCVSCAKTFKTEDQTLFGIFCKKCGKKWEKERKLRQARLKKARGL